MTIKYVPDNSIYSNLDFNRENDAIDLIRVLNNSRSSWFLLRSVINDIDMLTITEWDVQKIKQILVRNIDSLKTVLSMVE